MANNNSVRVYAYVTPFGAQYDRALPPTIASGYMLSMRHSRLELSGALTFNCTHSPKIYQKACKNEMLTI